MSPEQSPSNWAAFIGRFTKADDAITFHGGPNTQATGTGFEAGIFISDSVASSATVSANVTFSANETTGCELVLYFDPARVFVLAAGITAHGPTMFGIRYFDSGRWNPLATSGDVRNLVAGRNYNLKATIRGSAVSLAVDGVLVARAVLPFPIPPGPVGISCHGMTDVVVSNYSVESSAATAFVVMQFGSPFDEIYRAVIKQVCEENHLTPLPANEIYGPGLIIADISQQITEARVVIAEITPPNLNVYYELGFAHALSKPTIVLAEKGTKMPFDVAPFRILFYENSIAGKGHFEAELRKHLGAILNQQ